ncbi:MAG: Rrf2 family transcriptional regulator [Bacteroidetes bacterium]|jgi:Rrf2 family protein|nr:Rrf2 family transcriptional regulator [Bacteroidota bacterium]
MLTKKARYALHALVHLAAQPVGLPVESKRLSTDTRLPRKFLESILTELTKAGIVCSKRGKGGGYTLQRLPADIPLVEVVRLFDGAIGIIPCVTFKFYKPCAECERPEECQIRSVFKEQRDMNVTFLRNKRLSDLIPRQKTDKRV